MPSPKGQAKESQPSFGEMFRAAREKAGKSLDQVVKHLRRYTIGYLSDVERGRRGALPPTEIIAAARFFRTDPAPLLKRAAQERKTYDLRRRQLVDAGFEVLHNLAGLPSGEMRDRMCKQLHKFLQDQNKLQDKKKLGPP